MDGFKYIYNDKLIPWKGHLSRVAACDICIDQIFVGGWGNTTIEAAALGTIPVSEFKKVDRYRKEYGPTPMVVVTRKGVYRGLKKLLSMTPNQIRQRQQKVRQWVEDVHSYVPTGNRLRKDLESVYKG